MWTEISNKDKEVNATPMTHGNYVGLTINLDQIRIKELYHGNQRWSKVSYRVRVRWLGPSFNNYEEVADEFKVQSRDWIYENPIEATSKFEKIRNHVRTLGEFRNLNKEKIPDYRDEPK